MSPMLNPALLHALAAYDAERVGQWCDAAQLWLGAAALTHRSDVRDYRTARGELAARKAAAQGEQP